MKLFVQTYQFLQSVITENFSSTNLSCSFYAKRNSQLQHIYIPESTFIKT